MQKHEMPEQTTEMVTAVTTAFLTASFGSAFLYALMTSGVFGKWGKRWAARRDPAKMIVYASLIGPLVAGLLVLVKHWRKVNVLDI